MENQEQLMSTTKNKKQFAAVELTVELCILRRGILPMSQLEDEFCHLTQRSKIPLNEIDCVDIDDFLSKTVNICKIVVNGKEQFLILKNEGITFRFMSYFFEKIDEEKYAQNYTRITDDSLLGYYLFWKTVANLKACMLACDHAIPVVELEEAYFRFTNCEIPYETLGYENILQFLRFIPEIIFIVCQDTGMLYLYFDHLELKLLLDGFFKMDDYLVMEIKEESNVVKGLLITLVQNQDCGNGVPLEKIKKDYFEKTDEDIPYQRLGYENLDELLVQLPGVTTGYILPEKVPTLFTDSNLKKYKNEANKRFMPLSIYSRIL